jgi:ubiquinone/menaquinone biosynthesis C-methylase UbiE
MLIGINIFKENQNMKKPKSRIPEGGAMDNSSEITMKQYSEKMKKMLGKHYDLFADNVINKVAPLQNSKVLEIGPGPGWGGISLLNKRPDLNLDGIEASADMVAIAIENARVEGLENRTEFFVGIGEDMSSILDNHYDLVISRESLHHWIEPEKVFKEISRVLKSDGKICIYDHRRDLNFFGKTIVFVFGKLKAGKMAKYWKSSISASYTQEEIREKLDSIGFRDWTVECDLMNLLILKR